MSSNDTILLRATNGHYEVLHVDVNREDAAYYKRMTAKTLEDAVYKAQEMQDIIAPEYGVMLDVMKEPKTL